MTAGAGDRHTVAGAGAVADAVPSGGVPGGALAGGAGADGAGVDGAEVEDRPAGSAPAGLPLPVFVNLWVAHRGARLDCHADVFTCRAEAAEDAAMPSLHAYAGTVSVTADGCRLHDLADLGAAVAREGRLERRDDERHCRALARGAGRPVL